MRILVTGASGFIGSNIVETLLKEGHEVVGIDIDFNKRYLLNDAVGNKMKHNLSIGYNNISRNFQMIWDDINNIRAYNFVFDHPFDIVYHLAASADIRKSYQEPGIDLKNNVMGTNEILEIMRIKDIKNLVFSSSSSIYGVTKIVPTPENVPDIRPISMYGASKLANEAFINAYSDLYGIKAWIFRFANVIGRHIHRGVIVDFYNKLKKNPKELEILGDGNQEKSFFDVSDCINGFMNIPKMDKNKSVEIYNLANIDTLKVNKLADIVCDELGVSPKYYYTGGDRGWKGDTPYTILSIDKALKVGWRPKISSEESIRRTVRYLKEKDGIH